MITKYYCILSERDGKIIKKFLSKEKFHEAKKNSTVLFYLPIFGFRKRLLSLDDCEKIFFYLGQFLESHLSLQKSFENLKEIQLSSFGAQTVVSLHKHVEEGKGVDSFFYENEVIDDKVILSTLSVVQKSGNWGRIFTQLSQFIAHKKEIKSKMQSILGYPFMVMMALALFLSFILPQIVVNILPFMQENGNQLPIIAKVCIWIQENILISVMVFLVPIMFLYYYKLKILKSIFKIDLELEHFFYLLSFLLRQNIPMTECLLILNNENSFPSIKIKDMHARLLEGKSIADVFDMEKRFPKFVVSLLELSCETSKLEGNVENIYSILHKMNEKSVQKSISILPNLLILIIGGLFVCLVMGLFLPLYENAIHLVEGS